MCKTLSLKLLASRLALTACGSEDPSFVTQSLGKYYVEVAEGDDTTVPHGLGSKIIGAIVTVFTASGSGHGPGFVDDPGNQFDVYFDTNNINVFLNATNSEDILEKPIIFTVLYEE